MNTTARAHFTRGPLRTTALTCAGLLSGAALLLAGCSQGSAAHSASMSAPGKAAEPVAEGSASSPASAQLTLASRSIIYTARLTIRAKNVTSAANRATDIATAVGGYVSSEQASINPADRARSTVSLQLKIPAAAYPATLHTLSAVLGTQTSLSQHAQDVTQQVADVSSRVTSARAAITQLRALLQRAGSVSGLLSVQDQINAQESSLEALQSQQRALARETSYATVSVTLVSQHQKSVQEKKQDHGFVAGLGAGWRALRLGVSWVLTALGTVLPFAVLAIVLAGAGYAARRRLLRLLRRGSRPTTAA